MSTSSVDLQAPAPPNRIIIIYNNPPEATVETIKSFTRSCFGKKLTDGPEQR
jgi:hypothetical protein